MLRLIASVSLLIFGTAGGLLGQDCTITVSGTVYDEGSDDPLTYVNIWVQELAKGTTTDGDGNFTISAFCKGEYHFVFSHIGCESVKLHYDIEQDTVLRVELSHSPTALGAVVIEGKRDEQLQQATTSVTRSQIERKANLNLSSIIENETGISSLKNGAGVAKPIVHGLYGNRIAILNNGVPQSGQQWGNDHSPEIDPFAADRVTIYKGVSAIEYAGGSMGSVILVEPTSIGDEPHLHGQVNYTYETNGRGHTLNTRLQQYTPTVAWRLTGTLKQYGDRTSPDYYLNNTGLGERNLALQLERRWSDKLFVDLYASTFHTELGILRGSHIGNLTDLEQALTSEQPFFTEPDFSYAIDAPRQVVSHHLVKAKMKYYIRDQQILKVMAAGQLNDRKEYDVRRSGRSVIPSLSLQQYTFTTEAKYTAYLPHDWQFRLGTQTIITDNSNQPGTGILPLIPDYISWKMGLFSTISKTMTKGKVSAGIRYDYEDQLALTISNSIPREVERFESSFQNVSGLLAGQYDISTAHSVSISAGYAMRNPAINELYSRGLHQGVSGIEEGDVDLQSEHAIKSTLVYKWLPSANFSLSTLMYYQHFQDYIFLNPQDEFRLTIRGAFPVFKYEQTDAAIYGLDVAAQFTLGHSLFGKLKYSYLKGDDLTNDTPLVFMPANNYFGSITYRAHSPTTITKGLTAEETEVELTSRLVMQQEHILPGQDFLEPPAGYHLLGLQLSTSLVFGNYSIRCFVRADNIFNVRYRDYLNRQRYFADDLGRSVVIGANYKF